MRSVILCGCGNIGYRHLQALAAMSRAHATKISIVEPQAVLHPRIRAFIDGPEASASPHEFFLTEALPPDRQHFDLAIVATNADVRFAAFRELAGLHSVAVAIFEKVLFQTIRHIDAAAEAMRAAGTVGFVNCGRRGFESYQSLREELGGRGPVDIRVTGSSFGLASNAVHFLDLAEFLNGSPVAELDAAGLDAGHQPSKRQGCVEVFGTLSARLSNDATVTLSCDRNEPIAVSIAVGQCLIHEADGLIDRQGDGTNETFATRHVSQMPYLYEQALDRGVTDLTPYDQSAHQHRLFISALRSHLGLSNRDDVACPIS